MKIYLHGKARVIALFFVLLFLSLFSPLRANDENEECTIGVAAGRATPDGRPLIWKTRDNSSQPNVELVYNTSYDREFIELVDAGKSYAWMGVNLDGFAILNSLASDLQAGSSGYSNGSLMRHALGVCGTVAEFEALLDETNTSGRKTHGNFAVLDSTGAAALYEIDGTSYWKFDATDSMIATQGFIIRTNFAVNGDGSSGSGHERYNRSLQLIGGFNEGDSLNYRSILRTQMRDFSDYQSNPVPVPFPDEWISGRPYGYIYTDVSICRYKSIGATVIQGILSGESPVLSTMWTMLGQPAAAITVPYWPAGPTPSAANGSQTAPLCDKALQIKAQLFDYKENSRYVDSYKLLDGAGGGLWTKTFTAEDSIFQGTEERLRQWRQNKPSASEILSVESQYANYALHMLDSAYTNLITALAQDNNSAPVKDFGLKQNYPNPFNMSTKIEFTLTESARVRLVVYDILGRQIAVLASGSYSAGRYNYLWKAGQNLTLSSGVYFARLTVNGEQNSVFVKRMVLIK